MLKLKKLWIFSYKIIYRYIFVILMNNLRIAWTLIGYKRMWDKYKIDIVNTNLNIIIILEISCVHSYSYNIYELKQKTKSVLSKTNFTLTLYFSLTLDSERSDE